METLLQIGELSIVVAAHNHNPTVLNPDFLKYNGIVPFDWELAAPPVCTDLVSQVAYVTGVKITAQFNQVIFTEVIPNGAVAEARVPSIAIKYIGTLPHVGYQGIGINPKGHVDAASEEDAKRYMLDRLLVDGPWKRFHGEEPAVMCQLRYALGGGALTLKIELGSREHAENKKGSVILFTANLHHEVPDAAPAEKLQSAKSHIAGWKTDIELFQELVSKLVNREVVQ